MMDKDLHKTLGQITMFSKMGKYISNKILKYNKSKSKKHGFSLSSSNHIKSKPKGIIKNSIKQNSVHFSDYFNKEQDLRHSYHHKKVVTSQSNNTCTQSLNKSLHSSFHSLKLSNSILDASPPVGYYKLNYKQIQKNPRVYNFKRSVPHFHRQNYHSNQLTNFYKSIPDSFPQRQTGLTQFKRIVGRQDIKGNLRVQAQNPHENRFILHQNLKPSDFNKSLPNFNKMLGRDQIIHNGQNKPFRDKNIAFPDYQINFQVSKKRLDTHVVKFEKYSNRTDKFFYVDYGISNCFNSDETQVMYNNKINLQKKALKWQNQLDREKSGIVPSYLDKTVNSRSALKQMNLKALQMNCSDIRVSQGDLKLKKIKKNKIKDIQDKQNKPKLDNIISV